MRAMRDNGAWLVVAPSSGINVWCAASGGHLSSHQVVTALKTSGVAERVQHRRAMLPQLAATGVIAREVERRARWQVKFGPVYTKDIPRYLAQHEKKTDDLAEEAIAAGFTVRNERRWLFETLAVVIAERGQ